MIVKVHKTTDNRKSIIVCDSDLIGKVFEENGLMLDLKSSFYKGEEMREKEIVKLFDASYFISFIGKKSVELGIKKGLVNEERIRRIRKVPYAQVLFM